MDKKTSFLEAVQQGVLDRVSQMLAQEPDLAQARTENDLSALLLAAYHGHPQIASLLASRRSDLTLFEACVVGSLERVRFLLAGDPGLVNAFSADGFQPLGLAAFFNQPQVVPVLLENGAAVNTPSRNAQKVPPLNSACASGSLEIVRMLLDHGADPNLRQAGGFVPLHSAAQNGLVALIELLLEHGTEINLRAATGQTALGFALEAKRTPAAELLRQHGGVE